MEISWNFVSPKKWEPCILFIQQFVCFRRSRININHNKLEGGYGSHKEGADCTERTEQKEATRAPKDVLHVVHRQQRPVSR